MRGGASCRVTLLPACIPPATCIHLACRPKWDAEDMKVGSSAAVQPGLELHQGARRWRAIGQLHDGLACGGAARAQIYRLSSKNHVDVPVKTPHGVVHFLVSHPTPPVFGLGNAERNYGACQGERKGVVVAATRRLGLPRSPSDPPQSMPRSRPQLLP